MPSLQWRVRLRLASFIERLLVRSTGGTGTGGARTAPWQSKRAVLKPESLLGMLLELVKDDDMRVRFAAASTCGRLFELVGSAQLAVTASSLYDQLRELLPTATDDASLMMARLLTLGNVLVASAPVRHLALYHLVELAFVTSEYHAATSAILRCVAARLGFDETRDLWHHFAGSVSWSMAQSDYDVLKAPYHILGYTSRRQCLDHTFRPVASMLLAQPNLLQDFEKLASFLKISSAQAMRECLPFIVGVDLGLSGEDAASRGALSSAALYGERWTIVNQHLLERWHCTGTPQVMSDLLSKLADQVVVTLLRNFYEPVEASNETKRGTGATGGSSARIADAVLRSIGSADAACATELKHLMFDIGHAETASLHEPPRPMCNALGTYHALRTFARGPVAIFSVSSSYHIVGQMLELVFRERLVNDQLRHLQALKLFLALSSKAVCTSAVVLRALIDGAVTLLGYLDLVDAAVGLLDWAFRALSALPSAPLELAALLVSVVSQTETHASSNDSSARRAGELLYAWLNERLVPRLLDGADPRFFRAALVVWPRPHSAQMSEHLGLVTLDELIDAISAMPQRPVNTCTLQRVASALRQANAAQRRRFSAGAVWQILERQKSGTGVRIGSLATQQGDAAARAFADIIFVCEGQLHTPSYDALPASADPASSYTLEPHDNVGAVDDPLVSLRAHLTLRVVDALRGPDGLRRSGLVTQRLRAILALMPGDISHCSPPTQLARQELELLTAFPSPALVPKERTLESLSSIDALRRAESFDTWVCWMASFVCDFQAGHGAPSFFGQLSTLVAADARLAGETLPVLLHALLHSSELDVDGTGPTSRGAVEPEGDAVELAFKLYFESLLRSDAVDKKVWAAVIGVILHMRRFVRDRDLPLSGDQWLRVDLLLLARRARDCKLFASSLLFIELAREHRSDAAGSAEQDTSHLLYSIYSNIEDPDGFYSVKNSDVRASLVHRLHHEQRWERAFSMHAADYESELAGAPRTLDLREKKAPATLGVGRALHELGFNRLAGLLGQSSLLDATPSAGPDIAYDVAWRSGSWDLPASGNAQPGTSQGLFSALRALNRERDSRSIASAVSGALSLELRGLSDVGTEANAEARRVARELLSLREVDLWHSKFVVPGSSEQSLRAARTAWTALPSTFE
jgi:ataxia telangiectasia mutated family protein